MTVIDVRGDDELVSSTERIADAQHVPMDELELFATTWEPDVPLVMVSNEGRRSSEAALRLRHLGFAQVATLQGGLRAWRAAGLPTVRSA